MIVCYHKNVDIKFEFELKLQFELKPLNRCQINITTYEKVTKTNLIWHQFLYNWFAVKEVVDIGCSKIVLHGYQLFIDIQFTQKKNVVELCSFSVDIIICILLSMQHWRVNHV